MMLRVVLLASSVAAVEVDNIQMYEGVAAGCAKLPIGLCGTAKTRIGVGAACKWETTCKLDTPNQAELDKLKAHEGADGKTLTDAAGITKTNADMLRWKDVFKVFAQGCNIQDGAVEQKKCCEGTTPYAYNKCAGTTECRAANTPAGCKGCVYSAPPNTTPTALPAKDSCAGVPTTAVALQVPKGVLTWKEANAAGAKCTVTATLTYKKNACAAVVAPAGGAPAGGAPAGGAPAGGAPAGGEKKTTAAPSSSATRGAPAGVTVLLGALALVAAMSA